MASYKFEINLAVLFVFFLMMISNSSANDGLLSTDFYSKSCPELLSIVRSKVDAAIKDDLRMGSSLIRLHFHDCFVNGCDGSVLLPEELRARPNINSLRGMEVIDSIKGDVEKACNSTVSCADILAISARDSVNNLGGFYWEVKLGRRDAISASTQATNNGIPSPSSDLQVLIQNFSRLNLTEKDLVVLTGAHTTGFAKCSSFKGRIYNEASSINLTFALERKTLCKNYSNQWDNITAPLDILTKAKFDNKFFKNIVNQKGLLHSDQQLCNDTKSKTKACEMVIHYANDETAFLEDFSISMVKMGDISPLTGTQGEIRKRCSMPN